MSIGFCSGRLGGLPAPGGLGVQSSATQLFEGHTVGAGRDRQASARRHRLRRIHWTREPVDREHATPHHGVEQRGVPQHRDVGARVARDDHEVSESTGRDPTEVLAPAHRLGPVARGPPFHVERGSLQGTDADSRNALIPKPTARPTTSAASTGSANRDMLV